MNHNYQLSSRIQKKALLRLFFALYLFVAIASSNHTLIFAQESSPLPEETEEASPGATIKELQKRIQKISEENREKIKGALDQLQQKKQALAGTVQRVSEEAVTIKGAQGTTIISVSENLSFWKNGKVIKISDIAVDNWATALGTIINDSLEIEVVFINEKSIKPKNDKIDLGTITALETGEIKISSRKNQEEIVYSITKQTDFRDPDGETVKPSLFSEDITVVIIGYSDDEDSVATTIQSLAPLEE